MILVSLSIAALFASGCSTSSPSNPATPKTNAHATAFEGSWKGLELTPGQEGPASLTVSGQTLEFHGAEANDWIKGTFTLREDTQPKQFVGVITECAAPEYVGQKSYAIYKINDGVLTITGNSPGASDFPTAFDAPGTRQFAFKHGQ
jgi:uncharacterized protein (TIGR03067 family)